MARPMIPAVDDEENILALVEINRRREGCTVLT